MQTLVNILPIIFVAVILIGAVGYMTLGTGEKKEAKKRSTEYETDGWRPLPPTVDKETAAAAFIPSLKLDSPEEEIEIEAAPTGEGKGRTYWKGEKPPTRHWKGEKEKTGPILRAFDFKES